MYKKDHFNKIKNDVELVLEARIAEEKLRELKKVEERISRREHISQKVKDMVWNRDGGKCVECGSSEKLEFDHIVPFSKGGSNTYRNIQLLCEPCNRKKSNKIG
ncbi:HNH endonuclease [Riemerella anatipestifer]|nr:HNH endonuclease [Riemerella anatipestifer]